MDAQSLLKLDEGLILHIYKDIKGIPTIGYGRNLDSKGISKDEATYLFRNDVSECLADLVSHLDWYKLLDDVRQAVLLNIRYNIGSGMLAFGGFLGFVQAGKWNDAAADLLRTKAAEELPMRYGRLAKMMATGAWPNVSN